MKQTDPREEKKYWLDDPHNVSKIYYWLWAVCLLLAAADLFYHKHVHFAFEDWLGFYGWYGFVACVLLVLSAKQLRKILKRSENYYER